MTEQSEEKFIKGKLPHLRLDPKFIEFDQKKNRLDEVPYIIRPDAFPKNVVVPLVMYIKNERIVIGEATINEGLVTGRIESSELVDQIMGQLSGASIDSEEASFVFKTNTAPDPYDKLPEALASGEPLWPPMTPTSDD